MSLVYFLYSAFVVSTAAGMIALVAAMVAGRSVSLDVANREAARIARVAGFGCLGEAALHVWFMTLYAALFMALQLLALIHVLNMTVVVVSAVNDGTKIFDALIVDLALTPTKILTGKYNLTCACTA